MAHTITHLANLHNLELAAADWRAPQVVKDINVLAQGGLSLDDAIKAASILLAAKHEGRAHGVEDSVRKLLRNKGLTV